MQALFTSCILLITTAGVTGDTDLIGTCSQDASNKFDLAISRPFTFSDANYTFPIDLASAEDFCRDSREGLTVAKKIIRSCTSGIQRQVAGLLLMGINRSLRRECKDNRSLQSVYINLSCFNNILEELRAFMRTFTSELRRVDRMIGDQKVPGICCTYFKFDAALRAQARSSCSEPSNRHLYAMQDDYAGDVLDMLCSNVKNNRKVCDTLVWPSTRESDKSKHSLTFVNAFLVTLSNLSE